MKHYVLLSLCLLSAWPRLLRAQPQAPTPGVPLKATPANPAVMPLAGGAPGEELAPRKLAVTFGLRLGLTYANTNFNQGVPKPLVPVETTWKTGLVAGFSVQLALSKQVALQQEYLFSQLSSEISHGGPRYTLRYLSLPLLLHYQVVPRVALVAGPQLDLLIQATQQLNGQTTDLTHDTEERGIGATAGLEVQLGRHLSGSARYLQGLNHIGIGARPALQEFKLQAVQVAVEVRL